MLTLQENFLKRFTVCTVLIYNFDKNSCSSSKDWSARKTNLCKLSKSVIQHTAKLRTKQREQF